MELKELEARRDAEQLKRKKGLNATIDASIGLNQVSNRFERAYRSPLLQNQVSVNLTLPISDHGKTRHAWLAAQSKAETAARQRQACCVNGDLAGAGLEHKALHTNNIADIVRFERGVGFLADVIAFHIELDIAQTVAEVNQRQSMTDDTRRSLQIAEDAYTAMLQRFIRGQATVNDLSLAQQYWQDARRNQITAMQDFWNSYYHLRQLTLYDFLKRQPIRH